MRKPEPPQKPIKGWAPIPYDAVFTAEEFGRLKHGLNPLAMEDKWKISYEEPHLLFYRSWTGKPVFRITLTKREDGGATVGEASLSKDLAANSLYGADYQVRLLGFLIGNLLLGQATSFPVPPGMKDQPRGVYQHYISGTGFQEETLTPKKTGGNSDSS
jgi:hypothetical protein